MEFSAAADADGVGRYSEKVHAGGGYVWDEVLEYRVWCYPRLGAEDFGDGDYYYAFATHEEAEAASQELAGVGALLALVLQREYIDEPWAGVFTHVRTERVTEWPVEFLSRPRRDERTIPAFLSSDAPEHRLFILRGEQQPPNG